eukprot:1666125-Amphidinium_carterae.1
MDALLYVLDGGGVSDQASVLGEGVVRQSDNGEDVVSVVLLLCMGSVVWERGDDTMSGVENAVPVLVGVAGAEDVEVARVPSSKVSKFII